jgi:hypothetical protein
MPLSQRTPITYADGSDGRNTRRTESDWRQLLYVLVSTPGFVILHDTSAVKSDVLESGRGNYYGITWSPTGSDLVLSHSGVDENSLVDLETYATSEQGYLTIGGQTTWRFLSAPHQVLWVDDAIVITNTGRNALVKLNPRDHSIVQHRYDSVLWDRLSSTSFDGAHLNSLYRRGDRLYAVAHNFKKGSYILELDWPSLQERGRRGVHNATGIHNLWIDESGRFIACDSSNGALIDAGSAETLWSHPTGRCYTRGLAATSEIVLVGHSDIAPRSDRRFSETGLWVLDRRDFRLLDYQYLGHFGAVQDVRIVDEPDLCHHGKPLAMGALDVLRARTGQVGKARLVNAQSAEGFFETWQIVLGSPNFADLGILASTDDELLLCIAKKAASGISGKLRWRVGAGSGHAGLIAGYGGPADDNMAAALFEQSDSDGLFASIWINRGEWKRLCSRPIPKAATRRADQGSQLYIQADFRRNGENLELRLWDELFLSAPAGDLSVGDYAGIRLLGQLFEFYDVQCGTTGDVAR